MGKYLKMADVFVGHVIHDHDRNFLTMGYNNVADFGFSSNLATYAAHAINSHDELVENMQRYKQEAEQWEARATNEASRVKDLGEEVDRLRGLVEYLNTRLDRYAEKMIGRMNM